MNILLIGSGYWGQICIKKFYESNHKVYIVNTDNYDSIFNIEINAFNLICVVTPNNTHKKILEDIEKLNYQNTVFCEKPLFELDQTADIFLKNTNLKIFISKVWLYNNKYYHLKNEINNNKSCSCIKFLTYNDGSKGNILYDLVYHDIYMIIDIFHITSLDDLISIIVKNYHDNFELSIKIELSLQNIELLYSRNNGKNKIVIIQQENEINEISLNRDINDPDAIKLMFDNVLNNNIDFKKNNDISLLTLKILEKINNINENL